MFIFYHEFNSLSAGAAVLITNLIRGLVNNGREVLLINYINGEIHKELGMEDQDRLTVINRDIDSIRKIADKIRSEDIIITTHFYTVYKNFIKINPRIIFFCVNTTSLNEANRFPFGINFRRLTKKLISILIDKNGIIFGDEYALEQNSIQFDLNPVDHKIVPVPVIVPDRNQYLIEHNSDNNAEIVFTYVGRAVDWKINPVKKILSDLIADNIKDVQILFKIVTDNAKVFNSALSFKLPQNIRLEFYENLSQSELRVFLIKNADLHFAMGTSALDGARLGIPTILLDLSYQDFPPNYRYNFVYESAPSFIGTDANSKTDHNGKTIKELVEMTINRSELKRLSVSSYDYMKLHHNICTITPLIEKYCNECSMKLNDARSGLLKYWF